MCRTVTCINDIVPGDVFKVSCCTWPGTANDQCYFIAIPCLRKDGTYWMQDTYELDNPCYGENKYQRVCEDICKRFTDIAYGEYAVNSAICNYYYQNQKQLTNESLQDGTFTFWFNVNDYAPVADEERDDYRESDVIDGVKLFFEHGYLWHHGAVGVSLVRKNAVKSAARVLSNFILNSIMRESWYCTPSVHSKYKENAAHVQQLLYTSKLDMQDGIITNAEYEHALRDACLAVSKIRRLLFVSRMYRDMLESDSITLDKENFEYGKYIKQMEDQVDKYAQQIRES